MNRRATKNMLHDDVKEGDYLLPWEQHIATKNMLHDDVKEGGTAERMNNRPKDRCLLTTTTAMGAAHRVYWPLGMCVCF